MKLNIDLRANQFIVTVVGNKIKLVPTDRDESTMSRRAFALLAYTLGQGSVNLTPGMMEDVEECVDADGLEYADIAGTNTIL